MSTLTLIRHGQARAFQDDSDKLSPLGECQARRLGQFWVHQRATFDEVYAGGLARQRGTAVIVGEELKLAGLPWPDVQLLEELNEFDAQGILSRLAPELADRDARFRALVRDYEQVRDGVDPNRSFQRMFEVVVRSWLDDEIASPEVETWRRFRERVMEGLRRITGRPGTGRRVAAFTSGGPIAVTVQTVLGAPDRAAIELNWRIRNCSLTQLIFSGSRMSLDSFNTIPHLQDPQLWSYR